MAFGTVPMSSDPVPIAEVAVPGTVNLVALRGTTATVTDGNGNTSAAVAAGWFTKDVYARASAVATSSNNSGDLPVDSFSELALDINITAVSGTTPTIQFIMERKGNDNNYYQIYASASINSNQAISTSLGAGMAQSVSFGTTARLRWVIGGTTPSFTFSVSLIGKS